MPRLSRFRLADVVEQRQLLHLGIGLQRCLVAGLVVLEIGDALDHIEILGARAVRLELVRALVLVTRDAVRAIEQLARVAAHVLDALQADVDVVQCLAHGLRGRVAVGRAADVAHCLVDTAEDAGAGLERDGVAVGRRKVVGAVVLLGGRAGDVEAHARDAGHRDRHGLVRREVRHRDGRGRHAGGHVGDGVGGRGGAGRPAGTHATEHDLVVVPRDEGGVPRLHAIGRQQAARGDVAHRSRIDAVALGLEHEGGFAVQRHRQRGGGTRGLPGQPGEAVVGAARLRAQEGRQRAAQRTQQRQAVRVLAVDHVGQLLAQALHLVHDGLAVFGLERAATRTHDELAQFLHDVHGLAERGFGLGDGVARVLQRPLLALHARDARDRALGLGGRHRIVARAHHALAGRQVFLQVGERGLALRQVAQCVFVLVGAGGAVEGTHGVLRWAGGDAARAASAAHRLDQVVENALRDLQHLGRGLVGLLVLDQLGGFLVQVHARHGGAVALEVGGDRGRDVRCVLGVLHARAHLRHEPGIAIAHGGIVEHLHVAECIDRRGIAGVALVGVAVLRIQRVAHLHGVARARRALEGDLPAVDGDGLARRVGQARGARSGRGRSRHAVGGRRTRGEGERHAARRRGGRVGARSGLDGTELQRAVVRRAHRGIDGARGGEVARRQHLGLDVPRRAAERPEHHALAGGARGRHVECEPVDLLPREVREVGEGRGLAVGQAHHLACGRRGEAHFVVGGGELGGVGERHIARCRAARVARHAGRHGEQVLAGLPVQREAELVLRVHRHADGLRHAAQQVAALGQVIVVEPQQAGEFAPAEHAVVQFDGLGAGRAEIHLELPAAREHARFLHLQRRGRGAQHQRLAARHEQAHGAVVGRHLRGLHVLVDLADDLVALVQQVVGRLPVAFHARDLLVHARHLLGQGVERVHVAGELFLHRVLDLVHATGRRAHARGGLVHAGDGHRSRGHVHGRGHHVLERVEHVGDGRAQSAGASAEHVLQLRQPLRAGLVGRLHRVRRRSLPRQQFVVVAQDGLHVHALADVTTARELPLHRLQRQRLPRVARGIDVGDVVARGLQGHLVGEEGARADVEQTHVRSPAFMPRAPRAACCGWPGSACARTRGPWRSPPSAARPRRPRPNASCCGPFRSAGCR